MSTPFGIFRRKIFPRLAIHRWIQAKTENLIIHNHPYGSPNETRESMPKLLAPEAWLQEIEQLISDILEASD